MPRGCYQRTESHKQKLREQIKRGALIAKEKGKLGTYERTDAHKKEFKDRIKALGPRTGENSPTWKGDKVGYGALHDWVASVLGRPSKCEDCGTESAKRFDWANKSGRYLRDVSDWERLCRRCHMAKDGRTAAAIKMLQEAQNAKRMGL